MYGDSHGSPGQDDHFDPSSQYEPGPFESGIPETDVKVAGPHDGTWSRRELGEMDPYRPEPSSRNGLLIKVGVAATAAVVVLGGGAAFAMSGGGSGKAATAAAPPKAQAQNPGVDAATLQQNADDNAKKIVMDRASKAAKSDAGKAPSLSAKGAQPSPTSSSSSSAPATGSLGNPVPVGQAQQIARNMLSSFGWNPSTEFGCLQQMWNNESGWRTTAANVPSDPYNNAYGIPQANPGTKMASVGSDWRTSASTQIKWGLGYIQGRYGSPCQAWAYWQVHQAY